MKYDVYTCLRISGYLSTQLILTKRALIARNPVNDAGSRKSLAGKVLARPLHFFPCWAEYSRREGVRSVRGLIGERKIESKN